MNLNINLPEQEGENDKIRRLDLNGKTISNTYCLIGRWPFVNQILLNGAILLSLSNTELNLAFIIYSVSYSSLQMERCLTKSFGSLSDELFQPI